MRAETVTLTLIGGPTALIEVAGLRILTDPTFDPPQTYQGGVVLTKQTGPAVEAKTGVADRCRAAQPRPAL
jgi:L-ascorbate metabolism protein UlaG (beta-lactamase superfamily)